MHRAARPPSSAGYLETYAACRNVCAKQLFSGSRVKKPQAVAEVCGELTCRDKGVVSQQGKGGGEESR